MTKLDSSRVEATLKQHGISATYPRLVIGHFFLSKPQHLTADEIHGAINAIYPTISRATVFNTLNLFKSSGLIQALNIHPEKVTFDSDVRPHHHIVDTKTGTITDFFMQGNIEEQILGQLPAALKITPNAAVQVIVRVP